MKKTSYFLRELEINRMPGFPKGLESLKLADNINVITGPNASGKSSTSRLMQQLIWPTKIKGFDASAVVKMDHEDWSILMDSYTVKTQRNGIDAKMSGIPTIEGCHRYLLPLHELIKDDENDLAKEILKQSMGGYDLDKAGEALVYSSSIKTTNNQPYRNIEQTDANFKDIRYNHEKLKKEEDKLNNLFSDREKAEYALSCKTLLDLQINLKQEELKLEEYEHQRKAYPSSMDFLSGDEIKRVEELEQDISIADSKIRMATEKINDSKEKLGTITFSTENLEEKEISILRKKIANLEIISRKVSDINENIESHEIKTRDYAFTIDKNIDPQKWKGLDLKEVGDLDKFLMDAYDVQGKNNLLVSELELLNDALLAPEMQKDYDSEKLKEGLKTLGYWLKEQKKDHGVTNLVLLATAFAGLVTAIITYFTGWGFLGLFPIIVLIFYALREPDGDTSKIREQDFEKLGLSPPNKWNKEEVITIIGKLIEDLEDQIHKQSLQQKLTECANEIKELKPQLEKIETQSEEWKEKMGTVPEVSNDSYASLYWFLTKVKEWQVTNSQLDIFKQNKLTEEERHDKELDKINSIFSNYGISTANDLDVITTNLNELETQYKLIIEQNSIVDDQQNVIKSTIEEKEKIISKLRILYLKFDLEFNNKESLIALINQLPDFKSLCNKIEAKKINWSEKTLLLQQHSLYENEAKLRDLSLDKAKEKAKELEALSVDIEVIKEEIMKIKTNIHNKKIGHELEDIISERDIALAELEELYETNLASNTGNLILEQLKKENQEQNQTKLFIRANELLGIITHGRYELLIEGHDNPVFKAKDTITKQGLELSEISTGTRVQFLLAIRLAFVESQETSVKLPIFADELLANSDDIRATAIIESLIEISREGRQIFYFTAQDDEVKKWQYHLNGHSDLEFKIISLSDSKSPAMTENPYSEISFTQPVPNHIGKTHNEYGRELRITPIDLLSQKVSQLHLWYLLENPLVLSTCLRLRIEYWGQLESYRRHKEISEKLNESIWKQLENKIKLLQHIQTLYRQGRSLPINREVLENSKTLTPAYIDDVSEKLRELNGDPKALITALKNNEIKIYKQDENTIKLEEYLFHENYIDDLEPLESSNFTHLISEFVSHSEIPQEEAETFCNRIFKGPFLDSELN